MTARDAVMGLFLAALSASAFGQTLTPETYIRADIAAREATLEGMAQRAESLAAGGTTDAQIAAAERTRERVDAVFASFGVSGASHAAYGSRHDVEIAKWLESQLEIQVRYESLNTRFKDLSQRLDALRGGN